ncbi:MAG: hypothetical protein Q8L01_03755 [Candidatus Woesebacteria bacterium]|nr:hypothetical protein [Candidatus Woesebacteria bacterium]
MINASNPNYQETISQIDELKFLIEKLENNVSLQLPQGVTNEFISAKNNFLNWVEEVEFTLGNYKK